MVDCIVEYDYEAEQPDELTIKAGQIIKNVIVEDGGWWEGELDGKKGMFPDNFVKIVKKPQAQEEKPVEKREDIKKSQIKTQQRTSVRDLASRMKDGIPIGGSQKKKEIHQAVIKRAKVLYSYEPDNDDELKLEVDEVVDVFKQEEEGWWEGSLNGKVGVFPSNFVEVIEELDAPSKSTAEEKPKEPPQAEPKAKKIVGGVGLGNIFDGGPIKLRSTPGSKKQPEPESKPEEPPSQSAQVRKDKQHTASAQLSTESATTVFSEYTPETSGSILNAVYEDDFVLENDIIIPPSMSICEKHVTIADIHSSFLGDKHSIFQRSSHYPEIESDVRPRVTAPDEDQLIEYADFESEKTAKNQEYLIDMFKLSDFSTKSLVGNVNSNNMGTSHLKVKEARLSDQEPLKYKSSTVNKRDSKKNKKSFMDKINQGIFKKKKSYRSGANVSFSNKISPVQSLTDAADLEEILKVERDIDREIERKKEVQDYTVEDFTSKDTLLHKFTSDVGMPVYKRSSHVFSKHEMVQLPTLQEEGRSGTSRHKSAPNIRFQRSSRNLAHPLEAPKPRSENYLASLNTTGHLSPFIRVIAEKYHLFQEKKDQERQPDETKASRKEQQATETRTSGKKSQAIEKSTFVEDLPGPSNDSGTNSPYVDVLFGKSSPDQENHLLTKSSSSAKKRPCAVDDGSSGPGNKVVVMTEKEFINNYVENMLVDVVLELEDEREDDMYSHHKEEFDRIRAKFETGARQQPASPARPDCRTKTKCQLSNHSNTHTIPTLAKLCMEVLDICEQRFIASWKKKYHVSYYTPPHQNRKETSRNPSDRPDVDYDNISCPSAARSDIYEQSWEGKLSLTGDSLSETSFSRGIDSYSLDQPSFDMDYKKSPWISPAPVRRLCLRQTDGLNLSTMSNCSDRSTQTTEYTDLLNKSGNRRPTTRNVSTSPIQELLVDNISLDDKSNNSSPRVTSKPRYSSSPIYNLPSEEGLLSETYQSKVKKSESLPKHFRTHSRSNAQDLTNSLSKSRKVERSHTINYLSDIAQSLAETRKKRFAFKHLFMRQKEEPVKLVSYKKVPTESVNEEECKVGDCGIIQLQNSPRKHRRSTNKVEEEKMSSLYPNPDFSTNDTYFNRSLEEDKAKTDDFNPLKPDEEPTDSPGKKFDHFGHWKVSYEKKGPQFEFQEFETKDRKYEFCSSYDNLISCRGDRSQSQNNNTEGRSSFGHLGDDLASRSVENTDFCTNDTYFNRSSDDDSEGSGGNSPQCRYGRMSNNEPETNTRHLNMYETEYILYGSNERLTNEGDGEDFSEVRSSYRLVDYPEDPVPEQCTEDSGEMVDYDLSPDSLSFMASINRQMKQIDLTDTPKADDDDRNLNDFLQEALKPLDELLSDTEEDVTPLSPSVWRCTASDYPSFVSFRDDDDVSLISDSSDVYPEPDPVELSTADDYPEPDHVSHYIAVDSPEECLTPNNSFGIEIDDDRNDSLDNNLGFYSPQLISEASSNHLPNKDRNDNAPVINEPQAMRSLTLDDWLNFNQVVSDATQYTRKERYPAFTFLTPHKSSQASDEDNDEGSDIKDPLPSTPGTSEFRSPEFTTCDNTFVSMSDMSHDTSRGCTPYFTDADTTIEEPVQTGSLSNSFNDEQVDSILVAASEDTVDV